MVHPHAGTGGASCLRFQIALAMCKRDLAEGYPYLAHWLLLMK